MSGRENHYQGWEWLPEDPMLEQFLVDNPDASALKGAGRTVSKHPKTGYLSAHTDWVDASGLNSVSHLLARFEEWKSKTKKVKADHEEYVKLDQQSPGRKSTILADTINASNTVLGGVHSAGKTVLG